MDSFFAVNEFEHTAGKRYRYEGNDPDFHDTEGTFEILEDMNYCAPTQDVLFAFHTDARRKVMSDCQFLDFLHASREVMSQDSAI